MTHEARSGCVNAHRRRLLRAALLSWTAGLWPLYRARGAEPPLALVVGNAAYRSASLKNPVADAAAVSERLRAWGYSVTLRENTTLIDLVESLRDFTFRAARSDVRLLFFAGHGIQSKGRNYLLPVDADPRGEDELPAKAVDIGEVVDRLAALGRGVNIVILDACRVNPFAGGVIAGPNGTRLQFRGSAMSGLASLDAPSGTLIAFSTAPNGVALDSGASGRHGVYVQHLLSYLDSPGLPVEQLFKKVRAAVAMETRNAQVPWESSSLTGDFCFRPGPQGHCSR